jgi:1,4-alpha-glucan branching enzyme
LARRRGNLAAFKNAKTENDAFDAARKFSRSTLKSAPRTDSPAKNVPPKITEFHLEAPFAESVKLAADFTEWEKFPLDMMKSEDGLWFITVPLPSGPCSYCFIVDGDGIGAAQRYASDDEDLHGRRATAIARSDGHVAEFW